MKKNNMMRLASVLLVLVLLTTCAISGTFAKYITKAEGTDSARVAYWGFGVDDDLTTLEITDLFKSAYSTDVQSATKDGKQDDLIAPGTANSKVVKFTYTDNTNENATAPEVAYTLDVSTAGSSCADDIKDNTNIIWKIAVDGAALAAAPAVDGQSFAAGSWDALMYAIEALDNNTADASFAPGEIAEAFDAGSQIEIGWEWIFEDTTHANADTDAYDDQDEIDTAMGNKPTLDTVVIAISVTATQVNA